MDKANKNNIVVHNVDSNPLEEQKEIIQSNESIKSLKSSNDSSHNHNVRNRM